MRLCKTLQIQHQPLALAAGAADHHALVLGLLFLAQDGVAVLRHAGDDPLLAGATDAELAGIIDVDAFIEQHLQDGLALRDEELLPRARELDREAAGLGGLGLGREIFDVDLLRAASPWSPPRRRSASASGRSNRGARPSALARRCRRRRGIALRLVVEMQARAAPSLRAREKCHVGARAAGIVERPRIARAPASRCTMHQIGVMPMPPANRMLWLASSMSGKLLRGALILMRPADAQLVVDVARAAAARRIALDAERVGARIGPRHDQGIVARRGRSAGACRHARPARRAAAACRPRRANSNRLVSRAA